MLHGLVAVAVVAGLSLPAVAMFAQPAGATGTPTIASDQADYPPGATVTLTGANWQADTSVTIFVNDSVGNTWSSTSDVTVQPDGSITDTVQLPSSFIASYSVKATGDQTGQTATTTFTDSNQSANLDQCANGPFSAPLQCTSAQWQNGNLNANQAHYREGDSVPYRMRMDNLSPGSHTLAIGWDTLAGSNHALDYLTSFDR